MSTRMMLLFILAFCPSISLATYQQPPSTSLPSSTTSLNPQDLLNQCIAHLEKLSLYEVHYTQWTRTPGLATSLKARSIVAPQRRVRYEAESAQGTIKVLTKIIGDGTTIWRISNLGDVTQAETYRITDMDEEIKLVELGKTNLDVDKAKQLRFDIDTEHGFHGLRPTIQDLQKHMQFKPATIETLTLPDGQKVECYLLVGTWNKEVLDVLAPVKKPGEEAHVPNEREQWDRRQSFTFFPRECRLYLDRQTLFPRRAEWWGPIKYEGYLERLSLWEWSMPRQITEPELQSMIQLNDQEKQLTFKELNYGQLLKQRIELMSKRESELSRFRKLDVAPDRGPGKSP